MKDQAAGGAAGVSTAVDRVLREDSVRIGRCFCALCEQWPPRMLRCGFILMSLFLLQLPELLYYKQALCEQLSGSPSLSGLTATPASSRTLGAAGWECCLCNVSACETQAAALPQHSLDLDQTSNRLIVVPE